MITVLAVFLLGAVCGALTIALGVVAGRADDAVSRAGIWAEGWGAGWRAAHDVSPNDPGDECSPIMPPADATDASTVEQFLKPQGFQREIHL